MRLDFVFVLLGLALMTAGVCLVMASWSAPIINSGVNWVRLIGPAAFIIGCVLLFASCFVCAIEQRLCCRSCRRNNNNVDQWTRATSGGRLMKQVFIKNQINSVKCFMFYPTMHGTLILHPRLMLLFHRLLRRVGGRNNLSNLI